LDSKPAPENAYHVVSRRVREAGGKGDTEAFLPGADASMFSDSKAWRKKSMALFGVADPKQLQLDYPALHSRLKDAEDTLLPSENLGLHKKQDAAVWVYAPQKRMKKAESWAVLESLSSGALVLLPQEVAGGYSHLPGVLAYDGAEGLEIRMAEIRQGRLDVERIAEESLEVLMANYLYEDQFDRLFGQAAIRAQGSNLPPTVAARFANTWLTNPQPPGAVVGVSGWYGERNVGDELILTSLVQGIHRASSSAQIVVASPKPSRVETDHGLAAYPRHEARAMAQMAEHADCLLVGGGGIWNDKAAARNGGLPGLFASPQYSVVNLATLPVMVRALGKPIAGVGLGVGPLDNPAGRSMVRLMASFCSVIGVRDESSKRALLDLGGAKLNVEVASDLAFAATIEHRAPRLSPHSEMRLRLAVNVRPADPASGPATCEPWPGLESALAVLSKNDDWEVVGVPCHESDVVELRRLFDSAGLQSSVVLPFTVDPGQLAADLGAVDLVVSMRLHASILSHRKRIPVVGLNYEEKIAGYFREMGEEDRLVDQSDPPENIYELIKRSMENRFLLGRRLSDKVGKLEEDAQEALDAILTRLLKEAATPTIDFMAVPD